MPKGHVPKKCSAKSKVYGGDGYPVMGEDGKPQYKPCQNWAIRGGTVCDVHGGRNPVAWNAAQDRLETVKIERRVAEFLEEHNQDKLHPHDGLLNVVHRTGAMVSFLGMLVGELEPGQPAVTIEDGEVHINNRALYGPDHLGDASPHVLMGLYQDWLHDHARACKLAIDAKLDERLVRQAESTTERLFAAVGRAMLDSGMPEEMAAQFRQSLANSIRVMLPTPGMGELAS